ncbi:DNA mismatch repair protein MutS [Flavimaricola marinus]|uniref:DNA mismatch repair protein MutS n=1 Tax=Flavimaricola marinus TaxID=1819565 RepID=A0A238LC73_9RHOB|nr:DNA mismatch repair protein MutS [Flavimaricola marinus]SMY07182.1 DNA mismatch repair protein MutS [Flavimaricola marinus]
MTETVTPMMAQFLEIKAGYPDALLFYRMGDFYEMFFDDAVAASAALDITLTKRGKHAGADIPMCGVPVHAAEGYFLTLIRKGFRVAVCEQMEDPSEAKKRGSKSVVRRDVVRLVTPGTLTEDTLLDARRHNYLAAYAEIRDEGALAWVDISTGAVSVMACSRMRLGPELARLTPREVLVSEALESELAEVVSDLGAAMTGLGRTAFDSTSGEKRLCSVYGVASLDAFGSFTRTEISALAGLVEYLDITQKGNMPLLRPPVQEGDSPVMQIDATTRRSLELTHAMGGGRQGSLLSVIDRTVTAAGARLLERRLASPACRADVIGERQASVQFMLEQGRFREDLREALRGAHDVDRALSRLALDRGGPRDMAAIRNTLEVADRVNAACQAHELPPVLTLAARHLTGHDDLRDLLGEALVAEPPVLSRDGGFIAPGYDADLDEARKLRDEGRSVIAGMQSDYAALAEVPSLKIKHNNVLGYFIETTATHAEKMMAAPLNETFIHRQTTANQVRFTTVDLNEIETRILNAGGHALDIEKRLYASLKESIVAAAGPLGALAAALAEFDLAAALADLAQRENWCRPVIDDSRAFEVTAGRHPVVEQAQARLGAPFVANYCALTEAPIWLLTGPNMAGKSTFLRQNALIAVLAQMGSYVPASEAHIGIVSQIFSRVGASDDLARGRSTFMVEMVETAAILNQADDRALVILDEIGRGTATYDGLSIAWATLEHLAEVNRCRAIFATHYHEMAALASRLDGVENATVTVKEWDGDVIFLHEVRKGTADRSYGVQVARLAGLPTQVVERAKVVLEALEKGEREGGGRKDALIDDLPLFSATPVQPAPPQKVSAVEDRLAGILPDELSPREALALVYELRTLMDEA